MSMLIEVISHATTHRVPRSSEIHNKLNLEAKIPTLFSGADELVVVMIPKYWNCNGSGVKEVANLKYNLPT